MSSTDGKKISELPPFTSLISTDLGICVDITTNITKYFQLSELTHPVFGTGSIFTQDYDDPSYGPTAVPGNAYQDILRVNATTGDITPPTFAIAPAIVGKSTIGSAGVVGWSQSSDLGATDCMGTMGLMGFINNDSGNYAYGAYIEARKTTTDNSARVTHGIECCLINTDSSAVTDLLPSVAVRQGQCVNLWLGNGRTDVGTCYDLQAGIVFPDPTGATGAPRWKKGILFHANSMKDLGGSVYCAIQMSDAHRICWGDAYTTCIYGMSGALGLIANGTESLTVASTGVTITGTGTVSGAFGCNTKTAQTAYASGGALAAYGAGANGLDSGANMSALHALVVKIRAALVANGIMS